MPKLFDTLLIRLTGPICGCPTTRKPDKKAYGIYFPVDRTGLAGIKVACKRCQKAVTIPWDDLSGHVVYKQPEPKTQEPEKSGWGNLSIHGGENGRGGSVVIRAGQSGSPGRRVGRVSTGSAWAHAEQHWKDAERQFEEMAGRFGTTMDAAARRLDEAARQLEKAQGGDLDMSGDELQRLWQEAPDVTPLFSQVHVETREQRSSSSGSPHEPEPQREPEPADPPAEEPADTRPAYMKHLGLEEQK